MIYKLRYCYTIFVLRMKRHPCMVYLQGIYSDQSCTSFRNPMYSLQFHYSLWQQFIVAFYCKVYKSDIITNNGFSNIFWILWSVIDFTKKKKTISSFNLRSFSKIVLKYIMYNLLHHNIIIWVYHTLFLSYCSM